MRTPVQLAESWDPQQTTDFYRKLPWAVHLCNGRCQQHVVLHMAFLKYKWVHQRHFGTVITILPFSRHCSVGAILLAIRCSHFKGLSQWLILFWDHFPPVWASSTQIYNQMYFRLANVSARRTSAIFLHLMKNEWKCLIRFTSSSALYWRVSPTGGKASHSLAKWSFFFYWQWKSNINPLN